MKKGTHEKKHIAKGGILISSSLGMCIASIILFALITVFSLIGLSFNNPHTYLLPFSLFSIYASAFIGGFCSAKKNKGADFLLCGLICGILIALLYSIIFFVIGIIFNTESAPIAWLYRAMIVVASTVGSLLGMNKPQKKQRRKRFKK